jgi:hypothetical protein
MHIYYLAYANRLPDCYKHKEFHLINLPFSAYRGSFRYNVLPLWELNDFVHS